MAVRLLGETRPLELCFWWEAGTLPERLWLRDEIEARSFLARLSSHGHAPALCRLIDPPSMRAGDDAEVVDRLAVWIASGRLHVRTGPAPALVTFDVEAGEEPSGERVVRPAPVIEQAPVPREEALPPETVDGAMQAAVLRRAAEKGIPFCEECERKKRQKAPPEDDTSRLDQAAMASTLVLAAQEGVPFCEECERGKAEEKRPPPEDDEDGEEDEDDEDEDGETSNEPRGERP